MFRMMITAVSLLATGPALALSCMVPNLAETYNRLNDAPDVYVLGLGTLSATEDLPPEQRDANGMGQPRTASFAFDGAFMSVNGLGLPRTVPVEVTTGCAASWCGTFPTEDQKHLVFLRQTSDTGFALEISACGGPMQSDPTEDQINAIKQCMRDGGCGPEQIEALSLF